MVNNIKKCLLIIIGTVSLLLGVTGFFLPVLPTTPFLLLTSFCYLRSSQRLYRWLMTRKVIGTYIFNYVTHKAVLKSTKICSIIFLWGTLIISMLLIEHWHIRIFLILVGIGVSVHLLMLKTIEKAELLPADKQYRLEETDF